MIKTTVKSNNIILFIVLFLSVLPIINIGSFGIPVLYLLTPLGAMILLFIAFGWIKVPRIAKPIIFIFFLITIEIFISTMYGTVTAFNRFIFPADSIQYIARFLFLISFLIVFYKGKVKEDIFIKYFLIILNIGMLIGILQWIPWTGRELFVRLYPFREGLEQLDQLNRSLHVLRVHGLAQFATANGGLAAFFFIFGYSVFSYYKKYKFLSTLLMMLSIINIFASQARAGQLALVFSFFLFYMVSIYVNRKTFKPTLYMILTLGGVFLIGRYLYNIDNPFINQMVYRWEKLFSTSGGSRVVQINYSFSLLKNTRHYIWGISRAFQSYSGLGFHIEVEPVNIFILYGVLGFILQYFLVTFLLIYFLKRIRKSINDKASLTLLVASFVGLLSYQVFSLGYFFFREARVGLFPWILMGVAIGVYERYKLNKEMIK